jgi:hypothetical protein
LAFNLGVTGLGVTLAYAPVTTVSSVATVGTYVDVTQLKSVEFPGSEVAMWSSTGIGSSAAEQIPTLFKAGELSFTTIHNPEDAGHIALYAGHRNKTLYSFKWTYPSAIGPGQAAAASPLKSVACMGYISKYQVSGAEAEGGLEATYSVSLTGAVTVV